MATWKWSNHEPFFIGRLSSSECIPKRFLTDFSTSERLQPMTVLDQLQAFVKSSVEKTEVDVPDLLLAEVNDMAISLGELATEARASFDDEIDHDAALESLSALLYSITLYATVLGIDLSDVVQMAHDGAKDALDDAVADTEPPAPADKPSL